MSRFFINRPIVAMVIAIVTVVIGLVSMVGLPIAQFPKIVPPSVFIQATYDGADAETLEKSVATPLEQQMSGVDDMDYMYSINANNGLMRMYVNFDVNSDPNTDHMLTQLRYSLTEPQLPPDVRNFGVSVQKAFQTPFLFFALSSPRGTYDNVFLANYAYINLVDQLTRVPGIASAVVFGAGQYAMRLWVKPDQLAQRNITVQEIVDAVNSQNTVNPAGRIGSVPVPPGQEFSYTVRTQGRLRSPEEFGDIVLRANPDGSLVRLKDVAHCIDDVNRDLVDLRYERTGQPSRDKCVVMLVSRTSKPTSEIRSSLSTGNGGSCGASSSDIRAASATRTITGIFTAEKNGSTSRNAPVRTNTKNQL